MEICEVSVEKLRAAFDLYGADGMCGVVESVPKRAGEGRRTRARVRRPEMPRSFRMPLQL